MALPPLILPLTRGSHGIAITFMYAAKMKRLQLRSRCPFHAAILASNVQMKKRNTTNSDLCRLAARSCHLSLGCTSLTLTQSAMMNLSYDHLQDQYEWALPSCYGFELSHMPSPRHNAYSANANLYPFHIPVARISGDVPVEVVRKTSIATLRNLVA